MSQGCDVSATEWISATNFGHIGHIRISGSERIEGIKGSETALVVIEMKGRDSRTLGLRHRVVGSRGDAPIGCRASRELVGIEAS